MRSKILVFVATGAVWALALAVAMFWALRWTGMPAPGTAELNRSVKVVADGPVVGSAGAAELAVLLGQALPGAEALPAPSRFKLLGVVAQGKSGAALLAMDQQPAMAYRVGSRLDENTVLQSVGPRHVVLGSGAAGATGQRLELPAE